MEFSVSELQAIASSGPYKRIPVKRELLADFITPVEAMRALRGASHHCFMLESAEESAHWGRYTFLGFDPAMEITCANGELRVRTGVEGQEAAEQRMTVDHPGEFLRQVIADNRSPQLEGFPTFTGGLVGYFSYDYIKYAEPTLRRDDLGHGDFLDMDLMLFDKLVVFDHYRQKIILIAGVRTDDLQASAEAAEASLNEMEELLRKGERYQFEPLAMQGEPTPRFDAERYGQMVQTAKQHIYEGDIFQVVLSNPREVQATGSLFDTYRVLRSENPSPYMFYFTSDDVEIAGASPETLAKLDAGTLYTYPLAGTRPRGATPEEDAALEAELLADEKELAEHNMLVDLGRNDLGRIAKIGSVQVQSYLDILRFSRVMHIGSTVRATIADDKDGVDAIDSILPAGTLSGAPKLRACQIIQELEGSKRGIYGGAIGYLDFSGNLDTCIAIRLAYKKNGVVCVQSGAGIVADSVPENEFLECQNKARAVVEALKRAEGGLR
ncbi:MAG: anthranilate synthase component I family protein [Eggerthellales bacterium]|nr:anthranilate synthase component I family protein [Eggerthellales bacterium]